MKFCRCQGRRATLPRFDEIYRSAGDVGRALQHYREAIRYDELGENVYEASKHRENAPIALANAGRLADAWVYAVAALWGFATFGDRAAARIEQARGLLAWIDAAMAGGGGGRWVVGERGLVVGVGRRRWSEAQSPARSCPHPLARVSLRIALRVETPKG